MVVLTISNTSEFSVCMNKAMSPQPGTSSKALPTGSTTKRLLPSVSVEVYLQVKKSIYHFATYLTHQLHICRVHLLVVC